MEDRIKPLKGVANFRDFGGYETREGGKVKPGRLFRAGHFHEATDDDVAFLDALDIDFQVDLRRTEERNRQPNKWRPGEVHDFDDGKLNALPAHVAYFMEGEVSGEGARNYMIDYYKQAPFQESLVDLYKRWFKALGEKEGGGLINCAAGKDRTGIGCALTLEILGVDDDTVLQDYELTNEAVNVNKRLPVARDYIEDMIGKKLTDEAVRPFLGVDADYLRAAIGVMNEQHGSPRDYAREVLGVDDALVQRLRERLVV